MQYCTNICHPWLSRLSAWSACEAIWCSLRKYSWENTQQCVEDWWSACKRKDWQHHNWEFCITSPHGHAPPWRDRYPHSRVMLTKIHVSCSLVSPCLCRCHALLHHSSTGQGSCYRPMSLHTRFHISALFSIHSTLGLLYSWTALFLRRSPLEQHCHQNPLL